MSATRFQEDVRQRLAELREAHLHRQLRRVETAQGPRIVLDGSACVNFSSNDYLGLAGHEGVRAAAARAASTFGAGSGASRLLCGSLAPHHDLEEALARFKRCEAALVFSCGYAAALGTVPALVGVGDVVIVDKLAHACLVDAARLSGARLRVFAHNDLEDLARILQWADARGARAGCRPRVLIVTESVFSMDGDVAPLPELVELKERHGAWLMVDEAHATGVLGSEGRGWIEACGLTGRVEVEMGTLGKALGAAGGYIAGSRDLVEWLIHRARSFVFSTAPVPAASAAATAALALLQRDDGVARRRALADRIAQLRAGLSGLAPEPCAALTAIVPVVLGAEARALNVADALRAGGWYVPAIRYPTVARGRARLRISATAAHSPEDVQGLVLALRALLLQHEPPRAP